ncbi:maestro heat-like repeat-containing protein family member 7 [Desmodus rotundus]|uniref:maestro heat-like repeat-containing protein family member 7 n=1 Tax=Desmodus rotundus TaxID=9430 RepID=UPI0023813A6C|nr:maestro heat-like repeat-containing protein family member 7 [Desmodus rotundus]
MGILGIFCVNANHDVSTGASEGLHYLFKLLVLHRSGPQKREMVLKDLQKHFRGAWLVYIQDLSMFFRKHLTPEERADVILVLMEAAASASENDVSAASKILRVVLGSSVPDIGKVPEIVRYIYCNMNSIPEPTAQGTVNTVLQLLAQAYADDVILTLFKLQDQCQRGVRKPWGILAAFPKCYEAVMGHLLQRLTLRPRPGDPEPSARTHVEPLLATRAIRELLLQPSRRMEVQALFPPLFMALLSQTSFLVVEGGAETLQDPQHVTEWMDPVSSTVETLKTLIGSAGYGDHVSYIQRLGGWQLLSSPERHYEGVALLARAMVVKNCWHNRPVFGLILTTLRDPGGRNHLPAFVFLSELLRCPDVAAIVDDATVHTLAGWFQCEEPTTVKLLLRVVEVFRQHGNMTRQLHLLLPYVLNCCYSLDGDVVAETLLVLRGLVDSLRWPQSSSFLAQLTFTLGPFFEAEKESLRLAAFEIYSALLAKVMGTHLAFPLKHQVLNLLVLLVLHLADRNVNVVQVCRLALRHAASILGWSRLKAVFAERDMWTILTALLKQEAGKALWFLKQSVTLFKSPQAPVRQAAVWFVGQIMQALDSDAGSAIEEAYDALKSMREDPDPAVGCLAEQTLYVMEAKEQLPPRTPTSCLCCRRL